MKNLSVFCEGLFDVDDELIPGQEIGRRFQLARVANDGIWIKVLDSISNRYPIKLDQEDIDELEFAVRNSSTKTLIIHKDINWMPTEDVLDLRGLTINNGTFNMRIDGERSPKTFTIKNGELIGGNVDFISRDRKLKLSNLKIHADWMTCSGVFPSMDNNCVIDTDFLKINIRRGLVPNDKYWDYSGWKVGVPNDDKAVLKEFKQKTGMDSPNIKYKRLMFCFPKKTWKFDKNGKDVTDKDRRSLGW